MKLTVVLLLCISMLSGCGYLKNLDAFNGYKGKPRIVESTYYTISLQGTNAVEKRSSKTVFYFDRKGRTIQHLMYAADGSTINGRWTYVYDNAGNMVQSTLYTNDSSIKIPTNYKYNQYGQEIWRAYMTGNRKTITTTLYDRVSKTAVIKSITNDTIFQEKTIIVYNDQWKEKELKSFDENDQFKRRVEFEYDHNGDQVLSKWYDAGNQLYAFYVTEYNQSHHKTRIQYYRVKGSDTTLVNTAQMEYVYDDKGNIIYEALLSNGKKVNVTRNQFQYPSASK